MKCQYTCVTRRDGDQISLALIKNKTKEIVYTNCDIVDDDDDIEAFLRQFLTHVRDKMQHVKSFEVIEL